MPSSSSSFWPQWSDQPVFVVLLSLLLLSGVVLTSTLTCKLLKEYRHVGMSEQMSPSISVSAEGTAVAKNDIATVDIGVTKNATSASAAQTAAIEAMNVLTSAMKEIGIASEDLQTSSYNVYPQYDYDQSPAAITGYEASQTLTVKIRESDLVNTVLGKAAELGATNIGSLRFEVDDDTAALNEARKEAIEKARVQAEETAQAMGVKLGDILSYSESMGNGVYPMYARSADAIEMSAGAMPDIQMGQNEVQVYVYLNYGVK